MNTQQRIRKYNNEMDAWTQARIAQIPAMQERMDQITARLGEIEAALPAAFKINNGRSAAPLLTERKQLLAEQQKLERQLQGALKLKSYQW